MATLPHPEPATSRPLDPAPRDTSGDGWRVRLENEVLTQHRPAWELAQRIPPVRRALNRTLINRVVGKTTSRPNRLSTMADHTSWDSLTDRSYSNRHLPPGHLEARSLPPLERVRGLFRQPDGTSVPSETSTLLFPLFAQWFTDGFMRTDPSNPLRNTSTHDIDLSQLYGQTPRTTRALRSFLGGKLKSQWIGDEEHPPSYRGPDGVPKPEFRALRMSDAQDSKDAADDRLPAERRLHHFALGIHRGNLHYGMAMLNTLFLREHNRLCDVLARANPGWRDDRLFDAARAVLTVMLIKIVIEDYIGHISPYHFRFFLQPGLGATERWYRQNWMSIEFNVLYRWHAMVPNEVVVGGRRRSTAEVLWDVGPVLERPLGALFEEASAQPAAALEARNTPSSLLDAEVAAVEIGRRASLASYNDYRRMCGFSPVRSFDQVSGRTDVQDALQALYRRVDDIEFYAGIVAEDRAPGSPLPSLMGVMVGIDAFSQALTNPLLATNVYGPETFSKKGMEEIERTSTLADVVRRNTTQGPGDPYVSMTLRTWRR